LFDSGSVTGIKPTSEVLAASIIRALIALMMEAASPFETSINLYQTTRRNNPEDSNRHTRRRENLKSHDFRNFVDVTELQAVNTAR
jgi:hypothetical protein